MPCSDSSSLYYRARLLTSQTEPLDLDIGDVLLRAYSSAHRYDDAAKLGRALYEQRAARCGARNAATLRCASSLIVPLAGTGDFSTAGQFFRETLAAQSDVLGSDDRDTLSGCETGRVRASPRDGAWRCPARPNPGHPDPCWSLVNHPRKCSASAVRLQRLQ